MTLEQFQGLVPKTVNDLAAPLNQIADFLQLGSVSAQNDGNFLRLVGINRNLSHMAMGMTGELGEIAVAMAKKDGPNLLEEITDLKWFASMAATYKGIVLSTTTLWDANDFFNQDLNTEGLDPYHVLVLATTTLSDVLKKETCYGKPKYKKQEMTPEMWSGLVYDVLQAADDLWFFAGSKDLTVEEGYDRVIEKLHGQRYKNTDGSVGFTEEAALNRDEEAEKSIIDNK